MNYRGLTRFHGVDRKLFMGDCFFYWKPFISSFELKYIFWESEFFTTYGVSICFMTRIFRGKITQKTRYFHKENPNFSGNFTPKNSGHEAD